MVSDPSSSISYKFGLVAMLAGLIGVPMGSLLAQRLRGRYENCDPYICAVGLFISAPMVFAALVLPQTSESLCFIFVFVAQVALNLCWSIVADILLYLVKRYPTADPVVCAFGLLVSAPLLTGAVLLVNSNSAGTYALIFFGQLALNLNWAIVADILLYVVVPTRRSTAEAFQILISHALGDAGSPYLVGAISESIMKHLKKNPSDSGLSTELQSMSQVAETAITNVTQAIVETTTNMIETVRSSGSSSTEYSDVEQFEGLQYALFSTTFVEVVGGIFFMITACFIIKDKYNATRGLQGDQGPRAVRLSVGTASGQKDVESFNSDCLVLCTDIALRERT
ncbi:hypothetical protein M5D96_010966 [Drosophila gunungcola]|uniref:Protein spinster n=1 Tax=Drosophila gunungcola TaxID=103775 RepID=A0A9P9YGI8_9MUSC|nr:hypothetical protein M5D96_010966 [Drosophila gunungcola]